MKGREEDLREDSCPVRGSVHLLVLDCIEEGWYANISLGKESWTMGREDWLESHVRVLAVS